MCTDAFHKPLVIVLVLKLLYLHIVCYLLCLLSGFGYEMDRWWPSRQILVWWFFFFFIRPKPKKNTHRWQTKTEEKYPQVAKKNGGNIYNRMKSNIFTEITAATGTYTPLNRMPPLKWAKYPLAPPSGKPINLAQVLRNINWESEYQKHKNPIDFNTSIVALTTLHTAVPLFTQITSIHNTLNTNNNISIVRGHLTQRHPALFMTWSGTSSARPMNPRQTSATTASEQHVCMCVCCVGAECAPLTTYSGANRVQGNGQKVVSLLDREMRPAGKQLGRSLAAPEQGKCSARSRHQHSLRERERASQGMTGRSKVLRHTSVTDPGEI